MLWLAIDLFDFWFGFDLLEAMQQVYPAQQHASFPVVNQEKLVIVSIFKASPIRKACDVSETQVISYQGFIWMGQCRERTVGSPPDTANMLKLYNALVCLEPPPQFT